MDAGLTFNKKDLEHSFIFDIKTIDRVFYLVADTEEEMNKWVRCICDICGFNPTDDGKDCHLIVRYISLLPNCWAEKGFHTHTLPFTFCAVWWYSHRNSALNCCPLLKELVEQTWLKLTCYGKGGRTHQNSWKAANLLTFIMLPLSSRLEPHYDHQWYFVVYRCFVKMRTYQKHRYQSPMWKHLCNFLICMCVVSLLNGPQVSSVKLINWLIDWLIDWLRPQ